MKYLEGITDNQRIANYLNNKLDAQAELSFENDLKKDDLLRKSYEEAVVTQNTLNLLAQEQLRTKLKNIVNDPHRYEVKKSFSIKKMVALAASILAFFLAGSFWYASTSFSNKALATKYFQLPESTILRGSSDIMFKEINKNIEVENFDKAIQQLETITKTDTKYSEAQAFLGLLYFKTQKIEEAKITLEELTIQPNFIYYEEIIWHQILLDLYDNKLSEVDQQINHILNSTNFSTASKLKAKSLQKDIQSLWRSFGQ